MTTLKPLIVTPPQGSAWAAAQAERKHKVGAWVKPPAEKSETIRVAIRETKVDE